MVSWLNNPLSQTKSRRGTKAIPASFGKRKTVMLYVRGIWFGWFWLPSTRLSLPDGPNSQARITATSEVLQNNF